MSRCFVHEGQGCADCQIEQFKKQLKTLEQQFVQKVIDDLKRMVREW